MTAQKCVVEGCNLEYDVVCSFSFYNVNSSESADNVRQEWINGAMHEESECLWRHVSLQLCGYHFEMDSQGLWIDSPMLPELLTPQQHAVKPEEVPTANAEQKMGGEVAKSGYQGLFEQFVVGEKSKVADVIRLEHNYSASPPNPDVEPVSRLNVRQLVDTLGYLSLKNLQRKQLWVVKVETEKSEASITQAEQVITKMQEPMQIIEIMPQQSSQMAESSDNQSDMVQMMEKQDSAENFIFEIAEEQEITMDEVSEIPTQNHEWVVNIVPDKPKPKYAFIKHCNSGKKKRHFTADINEVTMQGDFENYYILPDADPSVGVEITTSYEPDNYIVGDYEHLVLQEEQPKQKRSRQPNQESSKKKKKKLSVREQVKQIKTEIEDDWAIENTVGFDQDESDDYDPKNKSRARRKNKKYLGYDFVT